MLSALLRAGPSANELVTIERPAGAVNAAAAPLMKRVAIRVVPSLARPPTNEATRKTERPPMRTRRRDVEPVEEEDPADERQEPPVASLEVDRFGCLR
jgi:hypothetical protein